VRWFSSEHVERITHRPLHGERRESEGREVVLYGTAAAGLQPSQWEEFQHSGPAYAIAVVHVEHDIDPAWLDRSINYWALGGSHRRKNVGRMGTAHFCGSPQGRRPADTGPHGCAIVDVDHRGVTQRHTVTTDVVRWHKEQIDLPDHIDSQGLLRLIRDRAHALAETVAGRQALVTWVLTDGDQTTDTRSDLLAARLRQGSLTGELLQALRNEFGREVPGIWSLSLETEPPTILPSGWYEEDTVLGDLLRLVQQYQEDSNAELKLEPLPHNHELNQRLAADLMHVDLAQRERLLRQVAILGVDVMRGDRILADEVRS
jgi:DNA repair exonuclease SbcCD nuclease subunit